MPRCQTSRVRLQLRDIADAVGGRLVGPDVAVVGASIDSRSLRSGELFVPVVAGRDGHDFVHHAVANGAPAYLTARPAVQGAGASAVEVDDTVAALGAAAGLARARISGPVVGITGSVGKTSTKDLLAATLRRRRVVAASERSFNNELGVPLTLLGAPDEVEVAVVEMGARGAGHIGHLCTLARPTVGVVTCVAASHTATLGDLDAVARAKAELVEALPEHGVAVLNAEDPRVAAMAERTSATVVTFGGAGDVRAEHVELGGDLRARFDLVTARGCLELRLAVAGAHMVPNALAAAAAALACGLDLPDVAQGLALAEGAPWRMALCRAASGALVLNDAYNANPASTAAALRSLAALASRRRTAVLGPMAELGDSRAEHRRIALLAGALDIRVLSVGAPDYGAEDFDDLDEALSALDALGLGEGDAVLVKGSRVAGLERLADRLVAGS